MRLREDAISLSLLLDEPGDGSGGGTSSGAAGASGSGQASGSAAGASGPTSTGTQVKFEDDPRYKGVIGDLQKERKARQDYERKVATYEANLAERQRQIEALTGTKTPSKEEADLETVRNRMIQLFPALAKLTDEDMADKIDQILGQGERMNQSEQQHWVRHGKQMLDSVHAKIADEMGDLSERQRKRINAAYVAEAETNPDFLKRHEAGDPKLIEEFVKDYLADVVEPVKRKVTAQEAGRFRPVPGGRERSTPMSDGKPLDFKDDKAVMDLIVGSRKGQFGRGR